MFINYFVIMFQNVKINIIEAKFFENITITAKKQRRNWQSWVYKNVR